MEIFLATNLKLLRKYRKMSQEDVANKLNLTRSSYSGYENGVAEPGIENLVKMSKFYRIPTDDLLNRNLEELSSSDWEAIEKGVYADIKGRKLRVLTAMVSEKNEETIEMIPQKASAGYTLGYADPDYIKVLPTFQLPFLKKDKKYRSFPISGDSMPPVSPGSYVVAEYVQNWVNLKNNHPYILVTKEEGIVFKIVNKIPGKENVIQLSSTNPLYEPYLLDVNEIIEVWKFVNYISHDLPEVTISENDLIKSVKGIQKQVNEIKSLIHKDA
ncbi:DNA-binding protein [Brumimicrobium salinarum]|uniref:DNA-binding protein n=1 Tax=Brumimicrobium salinarum TaxID=2058658 RepID=A0A2I0R593_9FLAO|nr:LexA family transcriptional regulator [Brumimicrobium salinarum]PKR81725.1 DNA-binding protein [Brumimicrobium salinarum]